MRVQGCLLREEMNHRAPSTHSAVHRNLGIHILIQSNKQTVAEQTVSQAQPYGTSPDRSPSFQLLLFESTSTLQLLGWGEEGVLFLYVCFFFTLKNCTIKHTGKKVHKTQRFVIMNNYEVNNDY